MTAQMPVMNCRAGCGACCIAPSISSPIPGMPRGKAAGERCIQLDSANRCLLFGLPERPEICRRLRAEPLMCGTTRAQAMELLITLETATA
jgi:Fe-S-cluster containining protein